MWAKHKKQSAFTIVELLIVIVVIGILAAITIVAYNGVQTRATAARVSNDLRNISTAISRYYVDTGTLPCFDHIWDDTAEKNWASPYMVWPKTPWNGWYHWEHGQSGQAFSISIYNPGVSNATAIDTAIDDGNLSTGRVRGSGSRLEYGGMNQNVNYHCGP